MNQEDQRTLDSLQRVQDFLDTHADVLGTIANSEGRKEIDAAVAKVAAHHTHQGTADRDLAGQMGRQQALAKQLIASHLRPIAKFARGKLRGVPDYAALTLPVDAGKPKRLLHNARTMSDAAAKYADRFASAGLVSDTVQRLNTAADALEGTMKQRSHTKGLRKVSTGEIENALVQGRDGVRVVDALIAQLLSPGDALITAWKSISRIEAKPGKVRSSKAAPVVSAAPSAPAPAALTTGTPPHA